MWEDLFTWLDARLSRYAILASGVLSLFFAAVLVPLFSSGTGFLRRVLGSRAVFIFLIFAALFACRWPVLLLPFELNIDESQMVAQAHRLTVDPVPWSSADFVTGDPLLSYALILVRPFGFGFDYLGARVVGLMCIWAATVFLYLSVKVKWGDRIARAAVCPMMFFYCWVSYPDFLHYFSEHLSVALIAVAIYLGLWAFSDSKRVNLGLFSSGVCLGAVPFAKLQGAPVGAFMFLIVVIAVFRRLESRERLRALAGFILGGVLIPALIFGVVAADSILGDFWISFLRISGLYGEGLLMPGKWIEYLTTSEEFFYYLLGIGAVVVPGLVFLLSWGRDLLKERRGWVVIVFGFLLVSIFLVLKPGRAYWHYFHFLVAPLCITAAFMLHLLLDYWERLQFKEKKSILVSKGIVLAFLFATTLPLVLVTGKSWLRLLGNEEDPKHFAIGSAKSYFDSPRTLLEKKIAEVSRSDDSLIVWGRYPSFYVRTGLVPATRYATTGPLMQNRDDVQISQERWEYFRARFLEDLERSRPPFFIDSIRASAAFGTPDQRGTETALGTRLCPDFRSLSRGTIESGLSSGKLAAVFACAFRRNEPRNWGRKRSGNEKVD